jgi:uncharacterized DUF497 family protein
MFAWDTRKAIANYEKHRVSFEEAATIFADPDALEWEDLAHSAQEHRYKRIGVSISGNILLVAYTLRSARNGQEAIRIISARPASRKERKAYSG